MKWVIILLLIAAGVWAYLNVDFTGMKNNTQDNTMNAIKNEKTIKKTLLIYYRSINGYFSNNHSTYCSGSFRKTE